MSLASSRQANLDVELLRFQMRLAHDLQCLGTNSYRFATKALHEIGAMIGGWTRRPFFLSLPAIQR